MSRQRAAAQAPEAPAVPAPRYEFEVLTGERLEHAWAWVSEVTKANTPPTPTRPWPFGERGDPDFAGSRERLSAAIARALER